MRENSGQNNSEYGNFSRSVVFNLTEHSADIVVEVLEYRNVIFDKLASWCIHVDDADDVFRVWNEFAFDGNFWNWKALAGFPILLNFQTYTVLEF